jgi:hypothetical protein
MIEKVDEGQLGSIRLKASGQVCSGSNSTTPTGAILSVSSIQYRHIDPGRWLRMPQSFGSVTTRSSARVWWNTTST